MSEPVANRKGVLLSYPDIWSPGQFDIWTTTPHGGAKKRNLAGWYSPLPELCLVKPFEVAKGRVYPYAIASIPHERSICYVRNHAMATDVLIVLGDDFTGLEMKTAKEVLEGVEGILISLGGTYGQEV